MCRETDIVKCTLWCHQLLEGQVKQRQTERLTSKSDLSSFMILNSTEVHQYWAPNFLKGFLDFVALKGHFPYSYETMCSHTYITEEFAAKNPCQIFQLILILLQNNCQWLSWCLSPVTYNMLLREMPHTFFSFEFLNNHTSLLSSTFREIKTHFLKQTKLGLDL